jgi:osmotically-inducible protein OsmY
MGVWRVDNLLKVRLNGRTTDAETEKQLKAALSWDPLLDSSTIDVAVIDRTAYLSGAVESSFEKAEAQDVASRIKGVLLVRNHLKVEPEFSISYYDWPYYSSYGWPYYNQSPYYDSEVFGPQPYLSDEQIKKNIENGFFWSPFVRSDDIKVTVDGGVATLTGTVGTWIGWGEADKDAHKSGATEVLNRVKVKKGHWW